MDIRLFLKRAIAHTIVSVLLISSQCVQQHLVRLLDLFLKHGELGGMSLGPFDERIQRWKQRLSKRRKRILDTRGHLTLPQFDRVSKDGIDSSILGKDHSWQKFRKSTPKNLKRKR